MLLRVTENAVAGQFAHPWSKTFAFWLVSK